MRRDLQTKILILVSFFLIFLSFQLVGQCPNCDVPLYNSQFVTLGNNSNNFLLIEKVTFPNCDNLPANPNDFTKAYRSLGPRPDSIPDANGYYRWDQMIWAVYVSEGSSGYWKVHTKVTIPSPDSIGEYDVPPLGSGGDYPNVNRTVIFVDYCHKINVDQGFNYQNKLDLIVCGELQVGNLVIQVTVPEVSVINVTTGQNEICINGEIVFSQANVTEFGYWIKPLFEVIYDENGEIVETIYINIEDYIYFDNVLDYNYFTSDHIAFIRDPVPTGSIPYLVEPYCGFIFEEGVTYQIYAYGINETGLGYSEQYIYPPIELENTPDPGNEFLSNRFLEIQSLYPKGGIKNTDEGITSTFNNFTLRLCDSTSVFKVDNLIVGNNTTLDINGTFYVNSISGGNNTQGFCVQGSGVILTTEGGIPLFLELAGGWTNTDDNGDPILDEDGNIVLPPAYHEDGNNCGFNDGTLPIELLSFTPQIKADQIVLNWTTGTEINNDFFTIERSRDLYGWEVLGFVNGAGNSSVPLSYSFSDLRPLDGLAYYRLKQTDFDGKFEYFGPIAAHYDLGMEGLDFKVLKQYTNWVIAVPNDGIYQVEVYNLMGHRLVSERTENTLTIPAPEGAVVIRVTDGFARSASRVVM